MRTVRLPPASSIGGRSIAVTSSSSRIIRSCWPKFAETPRMSTSPVATRSRMSSRVTPSCMSISSTRPSRMERAARARSEMAGGNRGSGKNSGWYSEASRTRGCSSRWRPSSVSRPADSQLSRVSRLSRSVVQSGQARVWCGWPDRSATVHAPVGVCSMSSIPPWTKLTLPSGPCDGLADTNPVAIRGSHCPYRKRATWCRRRWPEQVEFVVGEVEHHPRARPPVSDRPRSRTGCRPAARSTPATRP